jgi:tripartite-type tricarboxylate transporter receptor subunit TctC
MSSNTWIAGFLGLVAVAADVAAMETKYPVPSVNFVTHANPGGGNDLFLREFLKYLSPAMGIAASVESVRGGNGAAAVAKVAKSEPDGGTFYVTTPTYIQTTLLNKLEIGFDSLDPLAIVFFDPEVIYTRSDGPVRTLREALTYNRDKPGRAKWGTSSPASLERIALERLKTISGVPASIVTHEGGRDLLSNVINGVLDFGIGEIQEIRAELDTGKVRLLAVLTEHRIPSFPNLATAREQGFDIAITKFRGIAGPKGIPDEVAALWERAMRRALDNEAYKAQYTRDGMVPVAMGRAEARAFTRKFAEDVEKTLRDNGVIR